MSVCKTLKICYLDLLVIKRNFHAFNLIVLSQPFPVEKVVDIFFGDNLFLMSVPSLMKMQAAHALTQLCACSTHLGQSMHSSQWR